MHKFVVVLFMLGVAGCATVPQQPIACGPSFDATAPNLKQFEQQPGHWNYGRTPEYSFTGTPGEVVNVIVRPARASQGVWLLKKTSHSSLLGLDYFAFGSFKACDGDPRIEVTATLPPNDDGVYYVFVRPQLREGDELVVISGPPQANPGSIAGSVQPVAAAPTANASAPRPPQAVAANAPEPIYGNTGKYMCPFTEDGTVAPWVEKGMSASVGANVGSAIGAYAGQKALEQVPFIGGFLGGMAGKATGREIAIRGAGGWEFIKQSSDLSFNSLHDMARYLHATNASHPQYAKVLQATYGIYPELQQSMAVVSRR